MSTFWSVFIIVLTVGNLIAYAILLLWNSRMSAEEAARETTGHTFDGIVELNKPLPRWWLFMFVGSLVFAAVYLALYPGLGNFQGLLGWSSDRQYQQEVRVVERAAAPIFAEYAKVPIAELIHYPEAMAVGGRLFGNHCAICHGSDARGAKGYPDLSDTDWLWGGSPEQIYRSIADGRKGMMPPMAAAVGGSDQAVRDMAIYVQSLSRPDLAGSADASAAIARAKPRFAVCAACHGADGSGNTAMGAPNLTNTSWTYGSRLEEIEASIRHGRSGDMPAHRGVLSDAHIHVLAAYVYGLSADE